MPCFSIQLGTTQCSHHVSPRCSRTLLGAFPPDGAGARGDERLGCLGGAGALVQGEHRWRGFRAHEVDQDQ